MPQPRVHCFSQTCGEQWASVFQSSRTGYQFDLILKDREFHHSWGVTTDDSPDWKGTGPRLCIRCISGCLWLVAFNFGKSQKFASHDMNSWEDGWTQQSNFLALKVFGSSGLGQLDIFSVQDQKKCQEPRALCCHTCFVELIKWSMENKNCYLGYIWDYTTQLGGCFRKWWHPQIIHFNRDFQYKSSILGYHYFWKHPGGDYNEPL